MVPVMVGPQGIGKSTLLQALVPDIEMFAEIDLSKKDDDLSRSLRGTVMVELAELNGLAGKAAEATKALITRRVERWTPKYQEFQTSFPRRCVFVGTTNHEEFLDDETGNRRWLPLNVRKCDVARAAADMEQLWAEGAVLYEANGVMWQGAEALAKAEHAKHMITDVWREPVVDWLNGFDLADEDGENPVRRGCQPFRLSSILTGAVNIPVERHGQHNKRMGRLLRTLEYKSIDSRKGGGKVWVEK